MRQTKLFSPFEVGPLMLKNRISVPPMCMFVAKGGAVNDWHKVHYGKLAGSGAAIVCIEATAVTPDGRITEADLGLWSDQLAVGFADLVRTMRAVDPLTKIAVQLNHAGRKGNGRAPGKEGYLTPEEGGWVPPAPSAVAYGEGHPVPREMTVGGIQAMVQAFANAADRAVRAGVDTIQVHMAHGFLIHQFLSPVSNHRTDEYGGSFENRIRFALEVFDAVKRASGNVPVGVRVSATDWIDGGWDLEQTLQLAKILEERGCAFIDVSTGGLAAQQQIEVSFGYQLPCARAVKDIVDMPVFGVGLIIEPEQAESALIEGTCDMVDIGRAMLRNPHWGWEAALKLGVKVDFPMPYVRGMRR